MKKVDLEKVIDGVYNKTVAEHMASNKNSQLEDILSIFRQLDDLKKELLLYINKYLQK